MVDSQENTPKTLTKADIVESVHRKLGLSKKNLLKSWNGFLRLSSVH